MWHVHMATQTHSFSSLAYYAPLAISQSLPLHHLHSMVQFRLQISQQDFQESHRFATALNGTIHKERFLRISQQHSSYLEEVITVWMCGCVYVRRKYMFSASTA